MNRLRILLVDDGIDFSTGLREVFRMRGYGVEMTRDELAALPMIASNSSDAIGQDVKILGRAGVQLHKRILHLSPWTSTILIKGGHLLSDRQAKPRNGTFAYLLKPCPVLGLLDSFSKPGILTIERDCRMQVIGLIHEPDVIEHICRAT
jgi:DNA-binding NtrC family response regulator